MAKEREITRNPKFLSRKKNCDEAQLCEKCKHHQHVLVLKFGCDAMIFTDTKRRVAPQIRDQVDRQEYLHLWCLNEDDPPSCLEQFKVAGVLR